MKNNGKAILAALAMCAFLVACTSKPTENTTTQDSIPADTTTVTPDTTATTPVDTTTAGQ